MVAIEERDVHQPTRLHGATGRVFGFLMEHLSASNYRWVVDQLEPLEPKSYLEIGFGTGALARLVAYKLEPKRIIATDPSRPMVRSAAKKLGPFADHSAIELRHGDDTLIASLAGPFDAVVATHSFQFWRNPMATLARIHALIAEDGRLVLVLRKHAGKRKKWLPNPISKSGNELAGARQALADAGFVIVRDDTLRTGSHGFVAVKL